jgi:class 3 adenylate cyclase
MSSRITIDQTSRNVICSVVFVDLVEYSKKSVAEQLALKDRFTALLADALKDIAINDRIVLDTGDGAAMSFLGDPEDALFVGMSLRDALKGAPAAAGAGGDEAPIRIGINLGPVRLVRDINGHPNIVGDGINVAQRIMSFARPGQILASRSYFDVVSCLSDEYTKLFSYEGSRTDKHVREHEVYVVGESESAFKQARTGLEHRAAQTNPRLRAQPAAGEASKLRAWLRRVPVDAIKQAASAFLRDRKKVTIAGTALAAVVAVLAVALAVRKPPAPGVAVSAVPAEVKTEVAPQPAASPPAQTAPPAKPQAAEPAPASTAGQVAATAQTAAKKSAPAKPEPPPGTVRLSIVPWGEVFVDGRSRGVSPPMKRMKLAPGKHRVEVRNTTFKPHTVAIEVKSHEEVTIRHVFK